MTGPYGKLPAESFEDYHSNKALGSGDIAALLKNARGFQMRQDTARKDTAALRLGRAGHCLTLEGADVYHDRYAIGGPLNPKTGRYYGSDTKAFEAWAAEQGKPRLSAEEDKLATILRDAVLENKDAVDALTGEHEVSYRASLDSVSVQCRCDSIDEGRGIITDLKTTESLDKFLTSVYSRRYFVQAAHYIETVRAVTGLSCQFLFVAVEKNPPYAVGVFELSEEYLDRGAHERHKALGVYRKCQAEGAWPRDQDGVQLIAMPGWLHRTEFDAVAAVTEEW